ncbi:MAG: formylglycine-generating enzyme family protein, partial [Planctomycetes bacterium]|nr:formylglycine-generating enzyme family protein [Planctomycetota bacterium]
MPGKIATFKVRVWADDGKGPDSMVLVPAGWFAYQNTPNPEDWVFVDSFMIDKYEVTNNFYC